MRHWSCWRRRLRSGGPWRCGLRHTLRRWCSGRRQGRRTYATLRHPHGRHRFRDRSLLGGLLRHLRLGRRHRRRPSRHGRGRRCGRHRIGGGQCWWPAGHGSCRRRGRRAHHLCGPRRSSLCRGRASNRHRRRTALWGGRCRHRRGWRWTTHARRRLRRSGRHRTRFARLQRFDQRRWRHGRRRRRGSRPRIIEIPRLLLRLVTGTLRLRRTGRGDGLTLDAGELRPQLLDLRFEISHDLPAADQDVAGQQRRVGHQGHQYGQPEVEAELHIEPQSERGDDERHRDHDEGITNTAIGGSLARWRCGGLGRLVHAWAQEPESR